MADKLGSPFASRKRKASLDAEYVAEFARQVHRRYPSCPVEETTIIAKYACISVISYQLSVISDYDELLMLGWERHQARNEIAAEVKDVLKRWRSW